ncbi:HAD hydrolase-like protein [Enterococcus cecorum]|nr:HAD hydrolase-like protein [Enterococcus cecorum]
MTGKFVFCIDSDGCVMDTMTYKHQLFFGPLAVDVFEVKNREAFLQEWDRVNLFSRTRGVNRFVGLVMGLEYAGVKNIENLKAWVEHTPQLSNASLEAQIAQNPSEDLKKALVWSNAVNQHIHDYKGDTHTFESVPESLKKLHQLGKIWIVSSANKEAVQSEWQEHGLMHYVDVLFCQDKGKKEDALAQLFTEGYTHSEILMIGDSPGDLKAAEVNQVGFYPILVGKEKQSWTRLAEQVASDFVNQALSKEDYQSYADEFWHNLD